MSFLFESPVKTPQELPSMKYYPIFDKRWSSSVENISKANEKSKQKSTRKSTPKSEKSVRFKPYVPRKQLFKSTQQYCLDFGQKNFDAQKCDECNMMYTKGEVVDEKTHADYHDMFTNGLKYHVWKHRDVVATYKDGYVLRVLPSSPHYMHKKLDELFKIADIELGINIDLQASMKSNSVYFIFISVQKRIAGFVAAERIAKAHWLVSEEPLMASTEDTEAQCGVSRIWIHPKYRRQQIGTRLLDTLRANFLVSQVVPKEKLAFSDPTSSGKEFAKHYLKSSRFLIYMYST